MNWRVGLACTLLVYLAACESRLLDKFILIDADGQHLHHPTQAATVADALRREVIANGASCAFHRGVTVRDNTASPLTADSGGTLSRWQ
ncbi:MAG: hypothetical protein LC737_05330 [Chloroflexi bacterium]|nr:hypothetical protein [Chloroflexota bacterium]